MSECEFMFLVGIAFGALGAGIGYVLSHILREVAK